MKKRRRFSFREWEYKQTTFLLLSIVFFLLILRTAYVQQFLLSFQELGIFGALIAGAFFVVTFTTVPAGVVLAKLLPSIGAAPLALYAGLGALVGDLILLLILRKGLIQELQPLFRKVRRSGFGKLVRHRYLSWLGPVVGIIALLLPLPDELGVALLGIVKLKIWQFILVSFVLNTISFYLLFRGIMWLF